MKAMLITLTTALALMANSVSSSGQDPEQVEYVEEHAGPITQIQQRAADALAELADDFDTTDEHSDHFELDDILGISRLRYRARPIPRDATRVAESPEHEDYIETLTDDDRRASHPIIWFDDPDPVLADPMEVLPPPVMELPEGMKFIEGDLVVPENYGGISATYITSRKWSGGNVPYLFDANVSAGNQTIMLDAMADWEAVGNINFRPRLETDLHFLYIQNANFNASEDIGVAGGRHDIWLTNWGTYGTVMHELGHALLYYHEQSRFDRNESVQINFGNVSQSQCSGGSCNSQFGLRISFDREYGPYDFDSVMHYSECSFSNCSPCPGGCETITVLSPNEEWQSCAGDCPAGSPPGCVPTCIGQRSHLSYFDQKVMAMSYPQSNYRFLDQTNVDILPNPGSFNDPFWEWPTALSAVPVGGTMWILEAGPYAGTGLIDKRMTIRAPVGTLLSE